jgi:predicted small lipoprotein YifL
VPFTLLRSLALLAACGAVAACGQKGPLTLPGSAASAASAPAR